RSYYRDGISWLQFLCHEGFITLLTPIMREGVPQITAWQPQNMLGSYVDMVGGRLRVYGLPWQGAATKRSMEGMAQALTAIREEEETAGIEYRVLMMHTGVEGIVARVQGLPEISNFQPLRECVDYLALGHIHKPYNFDGWIYNPGSTETCGAEEAQWDDRGYYYVEVDTETPERIIDPESKERVHHAEHIKSKRRPFVRHDLRVDGLADPEELYARLEDYCRREGAPVQNPEEQPVVLIQLVGTLGFDAGALDQARMEEMARTHFQALFVRIDNNTNDQDYAPDDGEIDGRDRSLWHELERRIFEELVARDSRYLPAKEQWSAVLAELKQKALQQDEPEHIAQLLRDKQAELLT
ncbi:MAG TPA: hypothetical protein VGU68_11615, partial [Ktedonobacteraceae bacterium]|nr:hypothetical protein [Ktedonobacteraceae bacterium]